MLQLLLNGILRRSSQQNVFIAFYESHDVLNQHFPELCMPMDGLLISQSSHVCDLLFLLSTHVSTLFWVTLVVGCTES